MLIYEQACQSVQASTTDSEEICEEDEQWADEAFHSMIDLTESTEE